MSQILPNPGFFTQLPGLWHDFADMIEHSHSFPELNPSI